MGKHLKWQILFCNIFSTKSFFVHPGSLCPPSHPVTTVPAAPISQLSTLRLIASVNPDFAVTKIIWAAPGGVAMKSENKPNLGTVAKLPQVKASDAGAYVCIVRPWGNGSNRFFAFNVVVTVDGERDFKGGKVKALRKRIQFLLPLLMV